MSTHVSVMSTLLNLQTTKALVADSNFNDYKALVCVFLFGGCDTFNVLAPTTPAEHADYVIERSGLYDPRELIVNGVETGNAINAGGLALPLTDIVGLDPNKNPVTVKSLLPIAPSNTNGRTFGLHPEMNVDVTDPNTSASGGNGVQGLFDNGHCSFISNIGSLIEPMSRWQYNNNVNRPLGLFSHADLQRHWMTGAPHTRSQIQGWGGPIG